jgi:hypothetical protein
MKSKLKSDRCTKEPTGAVLRPLRMQVEINLGLSPVPQEAAPSVDLPASDRTCVSIDSIHPEPPCSSFPSLPRLRKLDARQPEITPGRRGSGSNDTVRSDEAVFGDTVNGAIHDSPTVEARNAPAHARYQIGKKMEVPKLAIPRLAPAPTNGAQCAVQYPGNLSPPLTSSPQVKLSGLRNAQQRTPVVLANTAVSSSSMTVARTLGIPPSAKSTIPKHQGGNPGVICQTQNVVASQTPSLLPRSLRRLSPLDSDPVTVGGGNDFGVIGDRRPSKNQQQSQAVGAPLVKVEPTSAPDGVDGKRDPDDSPKPESNDYPEPIYVGEGRYYVGRYLGGGAMGKVYSVANRESMGLAALKVIKRKNLNSADLSLVKSEWAILKAISEAKFVSREPGLQFVHGLLESWYDKEHIYFAMVRSIISSRVPRFTISFCSRSA